MEEKYQKLVKWIEKNGGYLKNFQIKEGNDGKTLITKENISSGEEILRIPSKLFINGRVFKEQDISKEAKTIGEFIVELKKGKTSFFEPYLNLLPSIESFKKHPLRQLNSKNVRRWNQINPDFVYYVLQLQKKYIDISKELDFFPKQLVLYGFLILYTRAWINKLNCSLVPVMDLLQHQNSACKGNLIFSNDQYFYSMKINKNINKNNEVFDNYGCKSNLEFLAQYNFIDQNPIQPIQISDQLTILQKSEIDRILSYYSEYPFLDENGPNKCLKAIFRIYFISDSEIKKYRNKSETYFDNPLRVVQEKVWIQNFKKSLQNSLHKIKIQKPHFVLSSFEKLIYQASLQKYNIFKKTLLLLSLDN